MKHTKVVFLGHSFCPRGSQICDIDLGIFALLFSRISPQTMQKSSYCILSRLTILLRCCTLSFWSSEFVNWTIALTNKDHKNRSDRICIEFWRSKFGWTVIDTACSGTRDSQ
jgi:hypothetical protein